LAIAWDKLSRNIRIELAKEPLERIDARHFIKFTRIEFERLMENSEIIPDVIINKFNYKIDNEEMKKTTMTYEEAINENKLLKRPDICGSITSINVNRRIWFHNNNECYKNTYNISKERQRNKYYSKKNTNNSTASSISNDNKIYMDLDNLRTLIKKCGFQEITQNNYTVDTATLNNLSCNSADIETGRFNKELENDKVIEVDNNLTNKEEWIEKKMDDETTYFISESKVSPI